MKKRRFIFIILSIAIITAISSSLYGYNYIKYENTYTKAMSQLNAGKYGDCISTFASIKNTYWGKKNATLICINIEKAKLFKKDKLIFNQAVELFDQKKYLEAVDKFKLIPENDKKFYKLTKQKIQACRTQYILLNINNAKSAAKSNDFDSAICFLNLALKIDPNYAEAISLKNEYAKKKEIALNEAKTAAENKAKETAGKPAEEKTDNKTNESADKNKSEYPKIECINGDGIHIYYNESQRGSLFSGQTYYGFYKLIMYDDEFGQYYHAFCKVGPGPDVDYTITFNYLGETQTMHGNTAVSPNTNIKFKGTATVTVTLWGKTYSFIKVLTK